jgi:hypothetical protein
VVVKTRKAFFGKLMRRKAMECAENISKKLEKL